MSDADFKAAGNKALAAKNYIEAIEAYSKAIELNDKDHTYFSNRSMAHLYNGGYMEAVEDAESCIALKPDWAKGYLRKGQALTKEGMFDQAEEALNAGLALDANDASLKSAVEDLERAKNRPQGGGLGGLFGPQMIAKLAGHPKFGPKLQDPAFMMKLQMMQTNPQAMLADPEMMEVLQAIISSGQDGGDTPFGNPGSMPTAPAQQQQSRPAAKPGAKKDELTPAMAAKERGNALYKEKKFEEAIAAYDEAYSLDKTQVMFLSNKAAVYVEMGQTDKAIEICNAGLAQGKSQRMSYEDTAKLLQRIGSAHVKAGDLKAALEWYGKAQLENFDNAIERKVKLLELDLKKAVKAAYINPELAVDAKERGNTAFRDGKFPDAIKEYEEAIKRDPNNPAYHNNLAATFLKIGLFNDAKREVEKALEIDKTYVKAWAKKGDIETYMKEYHKALDSYKAGLQLDPNNTLCKQGISNVTMKVNTTASDDEMKERQAHAMADPQIQMILQDPAVRQCLTDMQENPTYGQKALAGDANLRAKIEKLIAAGVLQVK